MKPKEPTPERVEELRKRAKQVKAESNAARYASRRQKKAPAPGGLEMAAEQTKSPT
jgi:hypothetical protein